MKKKFDKKRAQDQLRINFELQAECDSYEEWLEENILEIKEAKKYKGSLYNLFKDVLEDVFQRREEITLEELEQYIKGFMHPIRKKIFTQLLVLYQDVFHEDESFKEELVKETMKDLGITKENMDLYRNW